MYKVTINGVEKTIEAAGVTITNGNIIFFRDTMQMQVERVISNGHWEMFEVDAETPALTMGSPETIVEDTEPTKAKRPIDTEASRVDDLINQMNEAVSEAVGAR